MTLLHFRGSATVNPYIVVRVLQGVQGGLIKPLHEGHVRGRRNIVQNVVDALLAIISRYGGLCVW